MKKIMFNLLPAIFLLGSCCIANGQAATGDQITDPNEQIIQEDSNTNGTFQPVTVAPGATANVKLQFPTSAAGKSVIVQSLDGGTASTDTATIDQSGLLVFSFQVGNQPGVYRVIVIDPNADADSPNIIGVVRFQVNPTQ